MRVLLLDRDREGKSPSGQGLALNACFEASRGALVGEMESDDLRPPDAFRSLADALEANAEWDAATSRIELCGTEREGMKRFERWQNGLLEPRELARGRFIEIPALRASALFRRAKLEELRAKTPEGALYRDLWRTDDGAVLDFATCARGTPAPDARPHRWWPVDSDFWHRWFHHGFTVGKVPRALYYWRQYDAQSTRTHSRCSLEQLRRCKAYFLVAAALEGQFSATPLREIRVYSVGETLRAWSEAVRREIDCQCPRRRPSDDSAPHRRPSRAQTRRTVRARVSRARRRLGRRFRPSRLRLWFRATSRARRRRRRRARASGPISPRLRRLARPVVVGLASHPTFPPFASRLGPIASRRRPTPAFAGQPRVVAAVARSNSHLHPASRAIARPSSQSSARPSRRAARANERKHRARGSRVARARASIARGATRRATHSSRREWRRRAGRPRVYARRFAMRTRCARAGRARARAEMERFEASARRRSCARAG